MANNALHYVRFLGADGLTVLQRPEDIVTIMAGERKATQHKPAAKVVYLLLANNNRVEVLGETETSVLRKLQEALSLSAVITGELPETINPPSDLKETTNV